MENVGSMLSHLLWAPFQRNPSFCCPAAVCRQDGGLPPFFCLIRYACVIMQHFCAAFLPMPGGGESPAGGRLSTLKVPVFGWPSCLLKCPLSHHRAKTNPSPHSARVSFFFFFFLLLPFRGSVHTTNLWPLLIHFHMSSAKHPSWIVAGVFVVLLPFPDILSH